MIKIEKCSYCKRNHCFGVYSAGTKVWCSAECRSKSLVGYGINNTKDFMEAHKTINSDRKNKYLRWYIKYDR